MVNPNIIIRNERGLPGLPLDSSAGAGVLEVVSLFSVWSCEPIVDISLDSANITAQRLWLNRILLKE